MKLLLLIMSLSFTAQTKEKIIHIFTALCDNKTQGIVKVPAAIGDGDKPESNLYWGALYGIKTYFKKSANWKLIQSTKVDDVILERLVFKHRTENVYLVADAYKGSRIKKCLMTYFEATAGQYPCKVKLENKKILAGEDADLTVFVGHNGLMDFKLPEIKGQHNVQTMAFCCKSRLYFKDIIKAAGADSLLLTNGFMAPEAYVVRAAIESWLNNESKVKIARRTAAFYHKYQKCGVKGAFRLFKPE
jgi:hypothetical protein